MNPKRKKVQDYIIKYIGKIVSGLENVKLYENLFKDMNDKEFDEFMKNLRDKKINLCVVVPNDDKVRVNLENNIKISKELGFSFFKKVNKINDPVLPDHKLPIDMFVIDLPVRIAQQLLDKKISIPQHNLSVDQSTGQVTGASRASKITLPETQLLVSMGLEKTVREFTKLRGGDQGAAKAFNDLMYKNGEASQEEIKPYETGVQSTKVLDAMFNAMHIRTTLKK